MSPGGPRNHPAGTEGRKRLGAYYTPAHIVDHMLAQLTLDETSRILEPAGGDGSFVVALLNRGGVHPRQITVWDTDPHVEPLMSSLGVNFTLHDSLLAETERNQFTHVVGNPPYLNKQSQYIKAHRAELAQRYGHIGVNDTYAMFTVMALEQLKEGGRLSFVLSDTFLTLGSHRRFREHLLDNSTINRITLLPRSTFPTAAVNTCILDITNRKADDGHQILFVDCRDLPDGTFEGEKHHVPQQEVRQHPGALLVYGDAHRLLTAIRGLATLAEHLDGGLGMHTGDNLRWLAAIETARNGGARWPTRITADEVDGKRWVAYHKKGGSTPWWTPVEYAVDWRGAAQQQYGIPGSVAARLGPDGEPRDGFLVAGVAARLTARAMRKGALWDSNKVFAFFPKNPDQYPPEFFIAALNSSVYRKLARALNHTVSLQIRDLRRLPMLPFTPAEVKRLAQLGTTAVEAAAAGEDVTSLEAQIDTIVAEVGKRVGI